MMILLICCFVQLLLSSIIIGQSPASDYDAYGIRFTANDFLIVEAQNRDQDVSIFAIQFYNLCPLVSCTTKLNDSAMYIYSVSIGMNQSVQQQYFAFNGYRIDPTTQAQTAFIGMVENSISNSCNFTVTYTTISSQYEQSEYYVITVDPQGLMAYGFAFKFCVLYNLQTQQEVDWDSGFYDYYYNGYYYYNAYYYSSLPRFMPHTVAATNNYVILVGVINEYNLNRWVPTAYLIDVRNCNIYVNSTCIPSWSSWPQWTYSLTSSSWEMYYASIDYQNFYDDYNPLYCLSVDINPTINEILIGIQYFSSVVRLSVDAVNFSGLLYIDQRTPGAEVGFGKSVKYAVDGSIIILANNFSLDYQTWYSSSIETYTNIQNFNDTNVIPVFKFPNIAQPLQTPPINPEFLAIQVTSVALMFINVDGNVYVLLTSPPGYYTDTSFINGQNQIYFFNSSVCQPGTYKINTGMNQCRLCPPGTYNSGNMTIQCAPCSNTTSFCPLGSVSDTASFIMSRQTQIRAYPESPDNIIFDDILILNMFSLNASEQRCLWISPLFWALIVSGITISIIIFMGLLKLSEKCKSVRQVLKRIFRLTDLIGEGELWIGGLASFSILILCIFAYTFSSLYLYQYPIESASNFSFSCDRSLRNAKFSSNLQLLAAADSSAEQQQQMFDLINQQIFTLHLLFTNSLFQCNEIQILETVDFLTSYPSFQCSFDTINSVLSIDVNLTAQFVTIQFIISSSTTAGGLSIGLTGPEILSDDGKYTVQELDFQEPFTVNNQTLTQSSTIEIQLIKVINVTKSLQSSSSEEQYSGLYIPSFVYDLNQMFYNENNFNLYHMLSQTILTLKITNSIYYIRNIQEPIARQSEILFHNLLFTIVCMEIFGLVFLVFKLILVPLFKFLVKKIAMKSNRIDIVGNDVEEDEEEMKKRIFAYLKKIEEKDTMLKSIVIEPNRADPPQGQTSLVQQSTKRVQFSSVQQPEYRRYDGNDQKERPWTILQRSQWN